MMLASAWRNGQRRHILREIRRRTRVLGSFPDGQSALNLAAARLRYIAGTAWSTKRYLNTELLKDQQMRVLSPLKPVPGAAQPNQMIAVGTLIAKRPRTDPSVPD
jgi:hypothetical protein